MHKAYNGRLPSTLINCIAKKRNLSYSITARDLLLVARFNTRFKKDSVAYRGSVLWNMLSSRYTDLADTSLCNLVKKLKTCDLFKAAKFNVLSASTASFEPEEKVRVHMNVVYIIYTSELILCSYICVYGATRHNIHMYPYFLFAATHHLNRPRLSLSDLVAQSAE